MKLAIYGYGNLGKGVECAVRQNPDAQLVGAFTRRTPYTVKTLTGIPVYAADDILKYKDEIDVLIICGGSATDLPKMTPVLAKDFNVVDSFDTHANIPAHFAAVDAAAKENGNLALISAGWLFVTVFGFTIHPGIAAIFAVIAFFLVMGTISALHSRITIAYLPGTREIVYRKGPFRWWSRRRKFKAADVDCIREGAVYTGLRDIPRPVVFFRDGRSELMLDLTANKVKRGHLWTWLIISVERGNSE